MAVSESVRVSSTEAVGVCVKETVSDSEMVTDRDAECSEDVEKVVDSDSVSVEVN